MRFLSLTEKQFELLMEAVEVGLHYHRENWAEGDPEVHDDNGNWIRQYHWRARRLKQAVEILKAKGKVSRTSPSSRENP